jgi:glycosyltransferase involved in cell wall biosynthesis
MYQLRFPSVAKRMVVLENGYDEESFGPAISARKAESEAPLVLLHSGIVYPSERDPTPLFEALGRLKSAGLLSPKDFRLRFRAAVHEDLLLSLAQQYQVQDLIELCPAVPYRDALAEMLTVDALVVMQASNCNAQIPAKVYEYLRAGKPVLGLTDPVGDTAGVLRGAGFGDVVRLDSVDDICLALPEFLRKLRDGAAPLAYPQAVQQASRRERSKGLAQLLDDLC